MKIYSIYRVTNRVNGKIYIGFSSDISKRKYRHKHYCLKKNHINFFYNAIRKYGWDNFEWEVIYQTKDRNYCLNNMEKYFIQEYRSFIGYDDCNGYNMTLGGDGNLGNQKPKTEEHRKKISQSKIGVPMTQEHIDAAAYARSKEYIMKTPNGEIITIKNMSEFCRKNNLNQSHMISVFIGRYGFNNHKGYTRV